MNTVEAKMKQMQVLTKSAPQNLALYQQYDVLNESIKQLKDQLLPSQLELLEAYLTACEAIHLQTLKTACTRLVAQDQKWRGYLLFE